LLTSKIEGYQESEREYDMMNELLIAISREAGALSEMKQSVEALFETIEDIEINSDKLKETIEMERNEKL
jgi:hypothetical protein